MGSEMCIRDRDKTVSKFWFVNFVKGSQYSCEVLPINNWPTLDEKGFKKFKLFLVSVITLNFCESETIDVKVLIFLYYLKKQNQQLLMGF